MITRVRTGKHHQPNITVGGSFPTTPIARVVALTLAASGVMSGAHAQQAFSPAWFAARSAGQANAAATGVLPGGLPANSLTAPPQQSQAGRAQLAQSLTNLTTAARALALQQALQQQAHQSALAGASQTPDGLGEGGLAVDTNPLTQGWTHANAPTETVSDGQTTVTIEQTGDKAVLSWETFNIGRHTTVDFRQDASWSVLNRVNDPGARPSQIEGQIKAAGTVYILNRNGILFSGASQVNVAGLVASALNISDDRFRTAFINTSWDPTGPTFAADQGFTAGDIRVAAGALLTAAASGHVLLLGGNVENDGVILTPDGQTLLGAGQQVYLAASTDVSLRGYAVQLSDGGIATNSGLIAADRGNITLAGRDVSVGAFNGAGGVLYTTTTTTANGSITLQARDQVQQELDSSNLFKGYIASRTGNVSIADGAALAVLPELDDPSTVTATGLLAPSGISAYGNTVSVGRNALLLAPGGRIDLVTLTAPLADTSTPPGVDSSRVYVESGAILDVSGTQGVSLSADHEYIQVELRGNELRDDPLLRNSFLYGRRVWVDIRESGTFDDPLLAGVQWAPAEPGVWYGSPLFDATGYIDAIKRSVGELTSRGGTINLTSRGDVILREGSGLIANGGTLDYAAGAVPVTYLTAADGSRVPIAQAQPGVAYTGVVGSDTLVHARWNATDTWTSPLVTPRTYEEAHTDGQDAGTINIVAPTAVLDGTLTARALAGTWQLQNDLPPAGGTLTLGDQNAAGLAHYIHTYDYVLNNVTLQKQAATALADDFAPGGALTGDPATVLSTDRLDESGIGTLRIYADKAVEVAADADLDLGEKGGLTIAASTISLEGRVHAAGGSLSLLGRSTYSGGSAPVIRVAGTALLDAAGHWSTALDAYPQVVNGGSVTLLTSDVVPSATDVEGSTYVDGAGGRGTLSIAAGAVIDVSGGGRADRHGNVVKLGNGGGITLGAGSLQIAGGADLRAYALATTTQAGRGGSLALIGQDTIVGGDISGLASIADGVLEAGTPAPKDIVLVQPLVISAGEPLPVDVSYSSATLSPGTTVTSQVWYTFNNPASPLTVGADWTVPAGLSSVNDTSGRGYAPGATVAAGTRLYYIYGMFPVGYSLPADAFPGGIPGSTAIGQAAAAGSALPFDYTIGTGTSFTRGTVLPADAVVNAPRAIDPGLLTRGGFASYSVDGIQGLTVLDGTTITLAPQSRLITQPAAAASDTALEDLGTLTVLPESLRSTASLTLRSGYDVYIPQLGGYTLSDVAGWVVVGQGTRIDAGLGGTVSLIGSDGVELDGSISAPGGSISAALHAPANAPSGSSNLMPYERQNRAIWLGRDAVLDVSGALRPGAPDVHDWRTGSVLDGGTVTLDASRAGYVVTEAGSLIKVAGASAVLDLRNDRSGGDGGGTPGDGPVTSRTVWSNAGTVSVLARDGAWLDGAYDAHTTAPLAHAGTFSLSLGMGLDAQSTDALFDRSIEVRQGGDPALPAGLSPGDSLGPTTRPLGVGGDTPLARLPTRTAEVAADPLQEGGFATVALTSRTSVSFLENVNLTVPGALVLDAPVIRLDTADKTPGGWVWNGTPDSYNWGPDFHEGNPVPPDMVDAYCPYDCTLGADLWNGRTAVTLSAPAVTLGTLSQTVAATAITTANPGTLVVNGGQVLGFGTTTILQNVADARFTSGGDIVFGAGQPATNGTTLISGTLLAAGSLTFSARQLHPRSGRSTTITASGTDTTITILPGDAAAPPPQSVGGSLTFSASAIEDEGVLRAPLGEIALDAGDAGTVTLAAGSLIDVSAHGRVLPYGYVINGTWYSEGGQSELTTPPAKQVTLNGDAVVIRKGARVDLSGGGDMSAYQFVPGTGGSRDILADSGVYAVLPGVQPAAAPVSTAGNGDPAVGSRIYLTGVPGLSAGWYTLLPAEYALQPGGMRVQPVAGATDAAPGLLTTRLDGGYVVAGYEGSGFAGSRDSRTSTFLVMPAGVVGSYTEYDSYSANRYFAAAADKAGTVRPQLGIDAGQLALSAHGGLSLDGAFNLTAGTAADGSSGRGGLIDIASDSIAVVRRGDAPVAGYALTISGDVLSATGAESLMLGGTRRFSSSGYEVDVTADRILVANDQESALVAPELLLVTHSRVDAGGGIAGTGVITVAGGAVIRAAGADHSATLPLLIGSQLAADPLGTGQGALLAVSNASQVSVRRFDIAGPGPDLAGRITVQAGAGLQADSEILFDATADSVLDAGAVIQAPQLGVASSRISFGDAPAGTPGFVANADTLAALGRARSLVLRSYSSIDFHAGGDFDLRDPATGLASVGELVLDAAALRQDSGGDIAVGARQLTLQNSGGTPPAGAEPATPAGTLALDADQLTLGAGDSRVLGFSAVVLKAGTALVGSGGGSLTAGGASAADLTVNAPLITAATGASQALIATGALHVLGGGTPPAADTDALVGNGGQLSLSGRTVDVSTGVRLPAGVLTVTATGGDLTIAGGAGLDVSGRDQSFFDQTRTVPAGSITLTSESGDVVVASGAALNLADPQGGGTLSVTAPSGSLVLGGTATGGSFVLDAGTVPDFGALQAALNAGGFAVSRNLRIRTGDVTLDGTTRTRDFTLAADAGSITVTGTLDASGDTGGSISLSAAGDITLDAGAVLTVAGLDFDSAGKGGSVYLNAGEQRTVDGRDVSNPDAVLDIRLGSLIDLGVANAGAGARQIALDRVGSSIALPLAATISFPDGTPGDNQLVSDSAGTITYADGGSASIRAGAPFRLPAGASVQLADAGVIKVASGTGGATTVALPLTGAFAANGATALTAVPVTLDTVGSQVTLAGGAPVLLPNGTPGDDTITTTADSVTITTAAAGSTVTLIAGRSTLNMSAGSSFTLASALPAGVSAAGSGVNIRGGSSTVTFSHTGTSRLINGNDSISATFPKGTAAGTTLTLAGGGGQPVGLGQPAGTTGNTVTVQGSTAQVSVIAGGRTVFPDGTPGGVSLAGTVGYGTGTFYVYDAGGRLVNTVAYNSGSGTTATAPFTVPAGGWISAPAGWMYGYSVIPLKVVSGTAPMKVYTQTGGNDVLVAYNSVTALSDLVGGSSVNLGRNAILGYQGGTPPTMTVSSGYGGGFTVTDATLSGITANTTVTLSKAGDLGFEGSGQSIGLSLNGGGRYTLGQAALGSLTPGTLLVLGEQGALAFSGGGTGGIPLLLSASAAFSAQGTTLLPFGGVRAGTLHLRAPQTADGADLRINPVNGSIVGAAGIVAEGYRVYDLTGTDGVITDALKSTVTGDAEAFASHTDDIRSRLLARNPQLASVLTVEPGVEVINATEQPSQVTGTLAAGSHDLVLTNGATLTLPQGLSGSITPLSSTAILEITAPLSGLTVLFNGSGNAQSLVVPAGSSVLLPDGAAPGTLGFAGGSYQVPALAVLPDGTRIPFSNTYGNGYTGTLPPGTRLLFSTTSGTLNLGAAAAPNGVRVVLQAGTYRLSRGLVVAAMPAGSTIRAVGPDAPVAFTADSTVPVVLPVDSTFSIGGLALTAPADAPAALTLSSRGTVSVAAGTALTVTAPGSLTATAAGGVYVNGALTRRFAAGDTISVPAGAVLRLDAAGGVEAQSTVAVLVQAGAGYAVSGSVHVEQTTLVNYNSWLQMTSGASVTLTSRGGGGSFDMYATVPYTVYAPDGSVRADYAGSYGEGYVYSGDTVVLHGDGALSLGYGTPQVAVQINGGTVTAQGSAIHVDYDQPAVAVTPSRVSSDLVLPQMDAGTGVGWDLSGVRFGPDKVPGVLTLRAAGNVVINGSISDAVSIPDQALIDDASWSYNLVGGADLSAAAITAVQPLFALQPGKGDVAINAGPASDVTVRTGSGDIQLAAGRDIRLSTYLDGSSGARSYLASVYTLGRPAALQPASSVGFITLADGRRALTGGTLGYDNSVNYFWLASGGGDLRVTAQQDILGNSRDASQSTSVAPIPISGWMQAQGGINPDTGLYSVVSGWGYNIYPGTSTGAGVRDILGTLGGGNVAASAGRDVIGATVAAADGGMYVGDSPADAYLQTVGGGDVAVTSGRDILGGLLYVAGGAGRINAGGRIGAQQVTQYGGYSLTDVVQVSTFGTQLALGDAQISAVARGDAEITSIYNPTISGSFTRLSTYTDRSAVDIESLSGDVSVINALKNGLGGAAGPLPGTLTAVAFGGSIHVGGGSTGAGVDDRVEMVPAHNGDLTLLAQDSIEILNGIGMSDADPDLFRTPQLVLNQGFVDQIPLWLADSLPLVTTRDRTISHAADLYRARDVNPVRLYAVNGDITGSPYAFYVYNNPATGVWSLYGGNELTAYFLSLPKPADIRAGRDIVDMTLVAQNFTPDQTTVIQAGRDLVEPRHLYPGESSTNPEGTGIWISGPGALEVTTGRDLSLNRSEGIVGLGNQINPYLPAGESADLLLTVGAGGSGPDYAGFAAEYLAPGGGAPHSYTADLVGFIEQQTGGGRLSDEKAWEDFLTLPEGTRDGFVRSIFYKELERAGTTGVATRNYNDGYTAYGYLFPEAGGHSGDLTLDYSQIKSFYNGSIDILVPGGGINGGVAVVGPDIASTGLKSADQLGVVALRGGDVHAVLHDDFIVNQSRVFAIGGGDMMIWSSEGDINAGKGAKTSVLAPPPRVVFNPLTGATTLELTGAASGSGIATLITEPGQEPGDMWLMAPHGTVDAGDAGIRVSGNFVLAAQHVRGLDNIDVKGTSLGLPDTTVHVGALTDAGAAAAAAADAAQDMVKREKQRSRASVIQVEVLGFGDGGAGGEGDSPSGGAPQTRLVPYDPSSFVQLVGHGGQLDRGVQTHLTAKERRLLEESR